MVTAPNPWLLAADLLDPPAGHTSKYVPHTPHPPQREFLDLDCLDALYGGAAGGGKSWTLLASALRYVDVPDYAAIIFRRTYEDLKLPGALISRSKEWLRSTDARWNENNSRWTFPSGASLSFGYLKDADDHFRYQGAEFAFIGVDEAGQIRPNQLRYLFSRLRRPDSVTTGHPLGSVPLRMRLASNPGGRAHEYLKRRYVDRIPDPDDVEDTEERAQARVYVPARLVDNPSLDQGAYRESLAHLDPEERQQLLDGNWDARGYGSWFFPDLAGAINLGREYEERLQAGEMVPPAGGALHLGIDWGENTAAILAWPLEGGGLFIAREVVAPGSEPGQSTHRMLAMNQWDLPWGQARFDAAGIQSMRTFVATSQHALGNHRPSAKSVPFGAQAPRTGRSAARSVKGVSCTYLRRLVRRAAEGQRVQVLAVSPRCPELLRQLKLIERNPEDPQGAWLKADDQHGPDALVAAAAPVAVRYRLSVVEDAQAA